MKIEIRDYIGCFVLITLIFFDHQFLQMNPPLKNNKFTSKHPIFQMGFSLELPLLLIKSVFLSLSLSLHLIIIDRRMRRVVGGYSDSKIKWQECGDGWLLDLLEKMMVGLGGGKESGC
ncbi:hypothetical protein ABFS82_05G116800 [Erythranthe guttata]